MGSRRSGDAAKILRLHRFQHEGQADQFGIHRADRGQTAIAAQGYGDRRLLNTLRVSKGYVDICTAG